MQAAEPGEATAERYRYERDELLAISRALSSERDINKLLDVILAKSREITGADAGSVYIVDEPDEDGDGRPDRGKAKILHFILSQNDSLKVDLKAFTLDIDSQSIVGKAVLDKAPIHVPDCTLLADPAHNPWGFRHNRSFDQKTGYQARSMLTVPMLSAVGEVMGVIQLINKKRRADQKLTTPQSFETEVVPFDDRSQELALALASQAGVCLENAVLYKEISNLFSGFVEAAVTAIEARDPTTSGHSRRVATLTVALAEKIDGVGDGPLRDVRFSPDDLRQIEFAGVLHDFGKVGVRDNVLVKAKKLHDWQREIIGLRFQYVRKMLEAQALEKKLALARSGGPASGFEDIDRALAEESEGLKEIWALVCSANEPTLLEQPILERLRDLGKRQYVDADGRTRPYLEPDEVGALEVLRGSLTHQERMEIQSHVTHTIAFLETIPWGRSFKNVTKIAGAHHESMDGKGYPLGLSAEQIPIESKMLTISDIYDALTASDRPYKSAVPLQRALGIIESEVKAGRCDPLLFKIFVEAEVYKKVM